MWCTEPESIPRTLLRRLPSPAFWARGVHCVPSSWIGQVLTLWVNRWICATIPPAALEFLQGRTLAIEVPDLALRWVVRGAHGRLESLLSTTPSEASIRGEALDLLLLASQLEDADTLFFQRRLQMTGDTALGLQTRNLLDQQVWEHQPPPLRILLNRVARLALAARNARYSPDEAVTLNQGA